MNAASEPASPPSAVNPEALQRVAQWLKHNGAIRVRKTDTRRVLRERYPAGLLTDAELAALLDE
ncbi:hypothetical protein N5D52_06990 [Pseudomonas sp. GD03860]|uniref:hypothetical protein n=1 Tax=Pseudomonas sp. GD03860 TaxID=2975389 RepID=UPI00236371EC|nr:MULTISPECIES: hypothetical protein [Pseudomonas]MDD2059372.1 hypothetical protein [Pseudomonas putida]MDH0636681.1 hypothetical protein [Pseudomonas sp. GD03860]